MEEDWWCRFCQLRLRALKGTTALYCPQGHAMKHRKGTEMSQLRLFDSQPVEHFKGTLGPFDIEDEEVEYYMADAQVVLVVTATVDGATLKRAKDGDWVRTNKLTTTSVRVASGELREELIDLFHLSVTDQLTLPIARIVPPPAPPAAQPAAVQSAVQGPRASAPSASTHVEQNGGSVLHPGGEDDQDDEPEPEQDVSETYDSGPVLTMPSPIQLPKPGDETLRRFLGET